MMWLALVMFFAVALALLRGGRLTNLADIRLTGWPLLFLGFGLQAATSFIPSDASWARPVGLSMIMASFVILLGLVAANRDRPGMWLAGIGILMNFTVIAVNGGMPVLAEAAYVASGFREGAQIVASYKHVPLDETTRLVFLADVIPVRVLGTGQVISLGDVFLAVGLARFLESELRRPVRWFKRGISAEAGSAAPR